ncbi:hypothetical protein Pan216_43680 [Planctomycetes bacterium Pan216]|uniref:Uncharacterized protein n=1 Tax=Kolteria novifilia TaxID=2527975 RepID=A0A518B929_9BACT|nr:hypothetical protein Pan216_43680 [Planctomycetes bacterium Pan216]
MPTPSAFSDSFLHESLPLTRDIITPVSRIEADSSINCPSHPRPHVIAAIFLLPALVAQAAGGCRRLEFPSLPWEPLVSCLVVRWISIPPREIATLPSSGNGLTYVGWVLTHPLRLPFVPSPSVRLLPPSPRSCPPLPVGEGLGVRGFVFANHPRCSEPQSPHPAQFVRRPLPPGRGDESLTLRSRTDPVRLWPVVLSSQLQHLGDAFPSLPAARSHRCPSPTPRAARHRRARCRRGHPGRRSCN